MPGLPIVAIVGRPNVGKSTLFNRLVGERIAIVEDVAGTTRDRVYAEAQWGDHAITMVDTGGLELEPTTDVARLIRDQIQIAIEEADVIVLVVDVVDGITSLDYDIVALLRQFDKPVILAANKSDNEKRIMEAAQFYELGIGDPIPISAYHNLAINELVESIIAKLPSPVAPPQEEGAIKIAIVGRPNVGKSLLLNALLGQPRAIVSEVPGTTRDAVDTIMEYKGERFLLIDTAGIRKKGRIEVGVEKYSVLRALRAINRADIALLLIDGSEPPTNQDSHVAGYILEANKGMMLLVNKWDLAEEMGLNTAQYAYELRRRMKFIPYVAILFISAKLKKGIEGILDVAKEVYQERQKRIPTAVLNDVISRAVAAHAPPRAGKKRLKIYYATQTEVNPPTFIFFVNDVSLMHFSYQRFLENKLRQNFGFTGTPLRFIFKSRSEG